MTIKNSRKVDAAVWKFARALIRLLTRPRPTATRYTTLCCFFFSLFSFPQNTLTHSTKSQYTKEKKTPALSFQFQ